VSVKSAKELLSKENLNLLYDYLKDKKIFIVDKNSSSRQRLAKTFNNFGAKMTNVFMGSSKDEIYDQALQAESCLVLTDYLIKGGSGFDLLRDLRKANPKSIKTSLYFLVTGNTSQSLVARSAEEDVDSYILKPYTLESLQKSIMKVFLEKMYPSEYMKKIEEGKELLFSAKEDEAIEVFKQAMVFNPKPTLACFYIGQAHFIKEAKNDAKQDFEMGLSFNGVHFKCLVALFDLLYKDKLYDEAYQVVKKISNYFPANPDRINTVVRLAVTTKAFEDIETYYGYYKDLEEREVSTIKHISAGLYVAAKHYIYQDNWEQALRHFEMSGIASMWNGKFILYMVEILTQNNYFEMALNFLAKFPPTERQDRYYKLTEVLAQQKEWGTDRTLITCQNLLREKVVSLGMFKLYVKFLKEKGLEKQIPDAIYEASQIDSEIENYFKNEQS
jgi:CheY-like chemotaxis protein